MVCVIPTEFMYTYQLSEVHFKHTLSPLSIFYIVRRI